MSLIRSTLMAALVTVGGAAVLAAQAPTQAPRQHSHAHRAGKAMRGEFGKRLNHQLFKGITLSATEKANIKAVHEKYAPQMKALREQFKPQLQQARQARQKGDTAALKNLWTQTAAQRDQAKKLLESERNDLRNALDPANRAKFDANVTQLEQRVAKRATKAWTNSRKGEGK